jgi:hypothetical protein
MIAACLVISMLSPSAHAASGDPLLDLSLQGYAGGGYALSRGSGADVLGRAGAAVTGWVTPRGGIVLRADRGSYGLLDDEGNAFVFAEARYRLPDQDLALGLGVGSPVIWVEYYCIAEEGSPGGCAEGPWEYHDPIGTASLTLEEGLGPMHLPVALRVEASKVRLGVGVDVGLGWRFRRR